MRKLGILLSVILLSGCASMSAWNELKTAEYKDSARRFTATVPAGWMRCNFFKYFAMSKDGLALNAIYVERHRIDRTLEVTKKQYEINMTPQEWTNRTFSLCPTAKATHLICRTFRTNGHPCF